jgi:hypothetical protein
MAKTGQGFRITLVGKSGVDFNGKEYKAVKLIGDKTFDIAGAGEQAVGIMEVAPYGPGGAGTICACGETKAKAGGAIDAGAALAVDANGDVVEAVAGNYIIGHALNSAAADSFVELFLLPAGAKA